MQRSAPTRLLIAAGFAVVTLLSSVPLTAQGRPSPITNSAPARPSPAIPASSTLPATQPTTTPVAPVTAPPPTPAQLPPNHAQVTYTAGALFVLASNSSLNQILREISHETGIKISGGVTDERVFGRYGPDTPDQILSALLDGTGSNMLLVQGDGNTPAELVLTPRQGGPSPPNPNAHAFDEGAENRNIYNARPSEPQPEQQPVPEQSQPIAPPGTAGAAPADSSQPQSPNGVKTPQQIYDQLQSIRQHQQPASNPQ
jgi:hypothetical protein